MYFIRVCLAFITFKSNERARRGRSVEKIENIERDKGRRQSAGMSDSEFAYCSFDDCYLT